MEESQSEVPRRKWPLGLEERYLALASPRSDGAQETSSLGETMDFSDQEWETILWAVGGREWLVLKLRQWLDQINAASEIEKVEPKLAGALVTPEEVEALIAHVERHGR